MKDNSNENSLKWKNTVIHIQMYDNLNVCVCFWKILFAQIKMFRGIEVDVIFKCP